MMNIYFSTSQDVASMNHPDLGKYHLVKTGPKDSIYVTDKWSQSLTSTFGNKKIPKFNVGDSFKVNGAEATIEEIVPIFIDKYWTFKYVFSNGEYRIEDQLP